MFHPCDTVRFSSREAFYKGPATEPSSHGAFRKEMRRISANIWAPDAPRRNRSNNGINITRRISTKPRCRHQKWRHFAPRDSFHRSLNHAEQTRQCERQNLRGLWCWTQRPTKDILFRSLGLPHSAGHGSQRCRNLHHLSRRDIQQDENPTFPTTLARRHQRSLTL